MGQGNVIEREAELAALRAALDGVERGEGRVVALEGPAGIGKTALLDEALSMTRERGLTALTARGGELEQDIGYGVVRQLLARFVAGLDPERRDQVVTGAARLALPALGLDDDPLEEQAADYGLYWLVSNLCESRPLVLAVDDAHWSDSESLRFLAYLGRRVEALPLLLLMAARPREPGGEERLVALLTSDARAVRLELDPLSRAGAALIFQQLLGAAPADAVVAAGHTASGGNPFFLTEIAAALRSERKPEEIEPDHVERLAPRAIRRSLLLRLGGLGTAARRVAQALAVLGDDARVDDIAVVAELGPSAVEEALVTLADAGITAAGHAARFAHPIVRTAIHGDLGEARRAALHRRAAGALEARSASLERIAHHLALTTPVGDVGAAERLHAAGARALRSGAASTSVGLLRRALAEPPEPARRSEVLLDLGRAELASGALGAAVGHLREALESDQAGERRTAIVLTLSAALVDAEDTKAAVEALDAELVRAHGDDRLRLEVQRTSLALFDAQLAPAAGVRLREFGALPGGSPAERLALASAAVAVAFDPAARAEDAASVARRALADGELIADRPDDFVVPYMAIYALTMAEQLDEAERATELALADARQRGFQPGFMGGLIDRTEVHSGRGDLIRAAADSEAALALTASMEPSPVVLRCLSFAACRQVESLLQRGRLDAARAVVARASRAGDLTRHELTWVRYARGLVALAEGDGEAARADFAAVGAASRATGYEDRTLPWRLHAARAESMLGNGDAALALAEEQLTLARTWAAPCGLGVALRGRALAGAPADAPALLEEAIAALRRSANRLELAGALADLGRVLRRGGKRGAARAALEEGMQLAAECEADALVELARVELRRLGARPRRLAFSGIEGLTPTERQIAAMAASGMTNRQIAQDLFVTIKTVESHLANTYRKLDVSSRRELPAELVEAAS